MDKIYIYDMSSKIYEENACGNDLDSLISNLALIMCKAKECLFKAYLSLIKSAVR